MKRLGAIAAVLLLAGCLSQEERANLADEYLKEGAYAYDPRTELCYFIMFGHGGPAHVPCTPKVLQQITGRYTVVPVAAPTP